MSDLPEARQMPHGIDNVVGRLTFRLVYDKRSVDRRRLWLSRHKSVVSGQFSVFSLRPMSKSKSSLNILECAAALCFAI